MKQKINNIEDKFVKTVRKKIIDITNTTGCVCEINEDEGDVVFKLNDYSLLRMTIGGLVDSGKDNIISVIDYKLKKNKIFLK